LQRPLLTLFIFSTLLMLAFGVAVVSVHSAPAKSPVVAIAVRGTAIFRDNDLICLNEPPGGAPRFKTAGVACSSYRQPYKGIGVWITKTSVIITSPPNGRIRAVYHR
jgi:hypothetical protein